MVGGGRFSFGRGRSGNAGLDERFAQKEGRAPNAGAGQDTPVRQAVRPRGGRRAGGEVGRRGAVPDAEVLRAALYHGGGAAGLRAKSERAQVHPSQAGPLLAGGSDLRRDGAGVPVLGGVVRGARAGGRGDEARQPRPHRPDRRDEDRDEERPRCAHAVEGSSGGDHRVRGEPARRDGVQPDARSRHAQERLGLPRGHLRVERRLVPAAVQGLAGGRVRRAELLPAVVDESHALSGRKGRSRSSPR